MHLVLDPGAVPHNLVAAGNQSAHPLGGDIWRPDFWQIARSMKARQGARIHLVCFHMGMGDRFHLQRIGDHNPLHKGR